MTTQKMQEIRERIASCNERWLAADHLAGDTGLNGQDALQLLTDLEAVVKGYDALERDPSRKEVDFSGMGDLFRSWRKPGAFVSVRTVHEEHAGKTFLGIYLGDLATSVGIRQDADVITPTFSGHNPAIWVPALGRVVFGYESWWGEITDPDQLRQITDADIENVWYVQALKQIIGEGKSEAKSGVL